MRLLPLLLVLAATAGCSTPWQREVAELRIRFERGQAKQRAFELREFEETGFQPLADAEGEVRRVLYHGPYVVTPLPGVEIRRSQGGDATLQVIGHGQATAPVAISAAEWQALVALEEQVFQRRSFVAPPRRPPVESGPPPPPPPICHGWIARFAAAGAAGRRSASWAACGGGDPARERYAVEVARLAVRSRPACASESKSPLYAFGACFGRRPGG